MFIVYENIKYPVISYDSCDLIVYHATTIASNAISAGPPKERRKETTAKWKS